MFHSTKNPEQNISFHNNIEQNNVFNTDNNKKSYLLSNYVIQFSHHMN